MRVCVVLPAQTARYSPSMTPTYGLALFVLAAFASSGLCGVLRRRLVRTGQLDRPNARSSHTQPTPRGGGLAVVCVILAGWLLGPGVIPGLPSSTLQVLACAGALTAVFWLEDNRGLPLGIRFGVQGLAAAGMLLLWPGGEAPALSQGMLPQPADLVLAWLAWMWFMNLFNFMDGIDGISVAESTSIGLGVALVSALAIPDAAGYVPGILVAGSMTGFLWWNRPPARLFLGDVGSVPLGFILGFVLLDLVNMGFWAPAVILPLYYLADATLTLGFRAVRGNKVWQAHRDHFYQQAVRRGLTHGAVAARVFFVDLVLVALAAGALVAPRTSLALALVVVSGFLLWLSRVGRARQR